ncbi:MAG: hypothetical protein CME36_09000 [unclassified Hahellaceae]|nr:hypothetical protein [Hahellaceae bacterium]|tara:strand:- start:42028 stop:43041 length:1014 start_codon:yes stop_codon:yes gene_type:complete
MKLTICTLIAGIAAATAVQASDTRVFGERIMMPVDGSSTIGAISADGSAVLGTSSADHLISNDLNGSGLDTFLWNTVSTDYQLVNLDTSGAQSARPTLPVALSADGKVALLLDTYNGHKALIYRSDSQSVEQLPFVKPKAISGDGQLVAFVDTVDSKLYIHLYSLSTGERTRLPIRVSPSTDIALSMDGKFVAFTKETEAFRLNRETGQLIKIPFSVSTNVSLGGLSHDGNVIAYSAVNNGGWVYKFNSAQSEKLCVDSRAMALSGNGQFAVCDERNVQLVVKDLSSGKINNIPTGAANFFALGGVSNAGTVVWGTTNPYAHYDTNGKSDLLITKFK